MKINFIISQTFGNKSVRDSSDKNRSLERYPAKIRVSAVFWLSLIFIICFENTKKSQDGLNREDEVKRDKDIKNIYRKIFCVLSLTSLILTKTYSKISTMK